MARYEYPQVPRTSQHQPQPQPHQVPVDRPPHNDNRFSFVPTPAEAKGFTWHRHGTDSHHSEIPPLPQLPEHLNAHQEVEPANIEQHQHDGDPSVQAGPHDNHPLAPTYSHYPEYPPKRHCTGQTASYPSSDTSTTYRPSTSHTLDLQPDHQLSQDVKFDATMHHTQIPAHFDPPSQHRDQSASLGPDVNPLSPSTPTKAHTPSDSYSNTTNIAILPPTNTSTLPVHNFSPLRQPVRGGSWHYSLFSCGEPTICLTSLFCPCITYGRSQYRLNQRSKRQDPTNMLGYSACNGSCVAFGILCGVNAFLAAVQKTRVRKAYQVSGSQSGGVLDDCLKSICCCCCSVAQDEKEIRWREEEARNASGSNAGVDGRNEGYVPVGGMSFSGPGR